MATDPFNALPDKGDSKLGIHTYASTILAKQAGHYQAFAEEVEARAKIGWIQNVLGNELQGVKVSLQDESAFKGRKANLETALTEAGYAPEDVTQYLAALPVKLAGGTYAKLNAAVEKAPEAFKSTTQTISI